MIRVFLIQNKIRPDIYIDPIKSKSSPMSSATEEKVLRQRIADELRQALKSGITAPEDLIHAVENPLVRVLIIGGGGREHALAWKLEMSPRVQSIMCLPGNGGTSGGEDARIRNYGDSESDPQGVKLTIWNLLSSSADRRALDSSSSGRSSPLSMASPMLFVKPESLFLDPLLPARIEAFKLFERFHDTTLHSHGAAC